jgi:hypothetical protein
MKIIRFFSRKEYENAGQPLPAKKVLPEWYRLSEMTLVDPNDEEQKEISGLKKCVPFMDAMISGYVLTTPMDIFVSKNEDGTLKLGWNSPEIFNDFISERTKALGEKMPRPPAHYPNHLAFKGFWGMKTPRGWSLLVVHPLNRHDLPFTITSGIMDSDKYSTSGNIPFFIKEDFIGVIPAGTPFAQLIPIKRAKWKSIKNDQGIVYLDSLQGSTVRMPGKSYKKLFWQKKEYN